MQAAIFHKNKITTIDLAEKLWITGMEEKSQWPHGALDRASPASLRRNSVTLLLFCLGLAGSLVLMGSQSIAWKLSVLFVTLAAFLCLMVASLVSREGLNHIRMTRARGMMRAAIAIVMLAIIMGLWSIAWWVSLLFVLAAVGAVWYAQSS